MKQAANPALVPAEAMDEAYREILAAQCDTANPTSIASQLASSRIQALAAALQQFVLNGAPLEFAAAAVTTIVNKGIFRLDNKNLPIEPLVREIVVAYVLETQNLIAALEAIKSQPNGVINGFNFEIVFALAVYRALIAGERKKQTLFQALGFLGYFAEQADQTWNQPYSLRSHVCGGNPLFSDQKIEDYISRPDGVMRCNRHQAGSDLHVRLKVGEKKVDLAFSFKLFGPNTRLSMSKPNFLKKMLDELDLRQSPATSGRTTSPPRVEYLMKMVVPLTKHLCEVDVAAAVPCFPALRVSGSDLETAIVGDFFRPEATCLDLLFRAEERAVIFQKLEAL